MTDLKEFYDKFPNKRQIGFFTEEELDALQDKLPEDIIEFLRIEGKCTFGDDFLWTVMPDAYYEMFENWGFEKKGLNPEECHVFIRTAWGGLFFCYKKKYYFFNPFKGEYLILTGLFYMLFDYYLSGRFSDTILWNELYKKAMPGLPELHEDEIVAINPAIEQGGSPETSKVEVMKMKEYLAFLSGLYKNRVEEY